jgi:hypothetical protein
MIEAAGIPTVVISLIRLHSEIMHPPRALFVPFDLGRPLGDAGDVNGQTDILEKALALLDQTGPRPVLVDYPDPERRSNTVWSAPFDLPPSDQSVTGAALMDEFEVLKAYYQAAQNTRNRTSFGNADLSPQAVITLIGNLLDGVSLGENRVTSKVIRFAIDDLKTLYFEAASVGPHSVGSAALNDWFWRSTMAGKVLAKLRADLLTSDDKGRRLIANFIVPGEWVDKLAL